MAKASRENEDICKHLPNSQKAEIKDEMMPEICLSETISILLTATSIGMLES